jgi:hypothetical protein
VDTAWQMKKKHIEGSYLNLISLSSLIVNRGGSDNMMDMILCVMCVCLCVLLYQVSRQLGISEFG